MIDKNSLDSDQMLDRIVTALRDVPVPDFVDPYSDESNISVAILQTHQSPTNGFRRTRRRSRLTLIASAMMCVAALMFFIFTTSPNVSTNVAFAQVQDAVAKTKSLSCRFLDYHGDKDPLVTTSLSVPGVGGRVEGPDGTFSITNLKTRQSLYVDHRKRTARIDQLYPADDEKNVDSFMEKIRNLPASGAKQLEPTTFNGKKVLQFVFKMDGDFIVFVDPETKLPLRMELTIEKGVPGGKTFREVVTDLVFDAPVDESLFEIKPPPGYAVTRCEEPKDRKPFDTRTLVLSPAIGFGPVPLGSTKEKVIAVFGHPDQLEETHRGPAVQSSPDSAPAKDVPVAIEEVLRYPSLGFDVSVSNLEGVREVQCFGRASRGNLARDFLGRTDAQISLGASIDDVTKAYGKPDVRTHLRGDMLHYFYKGWSFVFQDGKLSWLTMSKPRSANTVITDNGDGSWAESWKTD